MEDFRAGKLAVQIAKEFGVGLHIVYKRVRRVGARSPTIHTNGKEKCRYCSRFIYPNGQRYHEQLMHPDVAEQQKQKALVLARQGLGMVPIGRRLDIGPTTVKRWVDEAGIPRRRHRKRAGQ